MAMPARRTEVAIVGLGPVGAVAANLAGAAGFDVVVLDRATQPYDLPRAIVFDAEVMRVFAATGLAEPIAAATRPLGGSVYLGADGRRIRTFRSPGAAHAQAWAPSNLFYQPQLELILREGLARFPNVQVRLGCDVLDVATTEQGATLRIAEGGGTESKLDARFVLACDGASSTLRKRLGIGLDDIGFEERWLVVDAHLDGPMRWNDAYEIPPEVRDGRYSLMICDPAQPATLIPGVGTHRRWEYMLKSGETDEQATDPALLLQRLSAWVDPAVTRIARSAVYRFRALVAQSWREGAVFLLGDAAHQTPPFYGQGMCHGIRDAAQLIWRLRLVADGTAGPAALDAYQQEREPHVREIIAASVKAGSAVCITDPERARLRDAEFRAAEAARGNAAVAMTDVVPPIRAGLVEPGRGGGRLPEFAASRGGRLERLDEHLGGRLAILSRGRDAGASLAPDLAARWSALGGRSIFLSGPEHVDGLQDVEGRFARWLESQDAVAAIVRPDRYVYGLPRSMEDLPRLLRRLLDGLDVADRVHAETEGAVS
jgi:3-(3-hydroxy-phenyl)propionate hydroxylase